MLIYAIMDSKLIALKSSLYHKKAPETYISKMGSHDPFEYLKHKLWLKEGVESQTTNLIPDH
jgi:hypothetical protein